RGEVILDNTREDSVAVKDTTAYYINSMLTNVVTGGGGTEARISGMTTAGVAGTFTDSHRTTAGSGGWYPLLPLRQSGWAMRRRSGSPPRAIPRPRCSKK
ncbi:MAG: hypothetical protein ACLT3D_06600, partial [Lawsonibacter sp.]